MSLTRYQHATLASFNIRDVEDCKSDIECVSVEFEVGDQAIDFGVTDVTTIDEGQQP
jgi:hypothetical protein